MKLKYVFFIVFLLFSLTHGFYVRAGDRILVALSGVDYISLAEGKQHKTGYYLSELGLPLKKLIDADYEIVIANPNGKEPTMDKGSDDPKWFKSKEEYQATKNLVLSLENLKHPRTFDSFTEKELNEFEGIFLPGGHAPMEDLVVNQHLGKILKHFHYARKPQVLLCHAPIALLSTLDNPETPEYEADLFIEKVKQLHILNMKKNPKEKKKIEALKAELEMLANYWPYPGYQMTVFSNVEEKLAEESGALEGTLLYYAAEALDAAGARLRYALEPWESHAEIDSDLITGQNPMSETAFTSLILEGLSKRRLWGQKSIEWEKVTNTVNTRTLYDATVFQRTPDWIGEYITLFIGKKREGFTSPDFLSRLTDHVTKVRNVLGDFGLRGYLLMATDNVEVAYQSWKNKDIADAAFSSPEGQALITEVGTWMEPIIFKEVFSKPSCLGK